ncbi:11023_t:CDS:2, partial [Rhizophagus irregularis]
AQNTFSINQAFLKAMLLRKIFLSVIEKHGHLRYVALRQKALAVMEEEPMIASRADANN